VIYGNIWLDINQNPSI